MPAIAGVFYTPSTASRSPAPRGAELKNAGVFLCNFCREFYFLPAVFNIFFAGKIIYKNIKKSRHLPAKNILFFNRFIWSIFQPNLAFPYATKTTAQFDPPHPVFQPILPALLMIF